MVYTLCARCMLAALGCSALVTQLHRALEPSRCLNSDCMLTVLPFTLTAPVTLQP